MRGILVLFSSTPLLAQVTPQTKPQAAQPKPKTATSTGSTTAKAGSSAGRPANAPKNPAPAIPATMTDEQKTIYALGLSIARSISQFDLSPAELDIVKQAISDSAAGKPAVEIDTWGPKIQGFAQARAQKAADREKEVSTAYLA